MLGLPVTREALGFVLLSCLGFSFLVRGCFDEDHPLRTRIGGPLNRYHAYLHEELSFVRASWTATGVTRMQLGLVLLAVVIAIREPLALVALPLIAGGPKILLGISRKKRVEAIERQMEGWLGALSRALEAAPSLGEALEATILSSGLPLREEIELVVQEMRLGLPLDRALEAWERRVRNMTHSLALATLRIGRQTGGSLPHVLKEAASTMREMERLQGVVRTKTAEGRAQSWVIGALPFIVCLGLDYWKPNHFDPLKNTATGNLLVALAVALWLAALLALKKILAVRI